MKTFKGKAIYNPSGKAGEYSYWACNFYIGCSNKCEYCYCKKGVLANSIGQDKPQLKKCFRDEAHALELFKKELKANSVQEFLATNRNLVFEHIRSTFLFDVYDFNTLVNQYFAYIKGSKYNTYFTAKMDGKDVSTVILHSVEDFRSTTNLRR